MLSRFLKSITRPHYLYRPSQVLRRAYRQFAARPKTSAVVTLPWTAKLKVNPQEHIGRSVYLHGLYSLVVSEALWRLLQPGEAAIDVGAHVGHMTSLMTMRVGTCGRVLAFEPHPHLFEHLEQNARYAEQAAGGSPVELFGFALSRQTGSATLHRGKDFRENQGTAYLADPDEDVSTGPSSTAPSRELRVTTDLLDDVVERRLGATARVSVLKIDVEGHEAAVLDGAKRLLSEGRAAHIIYEQHAGWGGPAHERLARAGYILYGLDWKYAGPRLTRRGQPSKHHPGETFNFLATRQPAEVEQRFAARGWRCLRSYAG